MTGRTFDDVLQIVKPDQDSQYRLIPCSCGSHEVVYAQYINTAGAPMWRVVCTDCGKTADPGTDIRHSVQLEWNGGNHGEIDRKTRNRRGIHRPA